MDVRVGLQRKLSTKELMLLNCGVGEDFESPLDCKEIQPVPFVRAAPGMKQGPQRGRAGPWPRAAAKFPPALSPEMPTLPGSVDFLGHSLPGFSNVV